MTGAAWGLVAIWTFIGLMLWTVATWGPTPESARAYLTDPRPECRAFPGACWEPQPTVPIRRLK